MSVNNNKKWCHQSLLKSAAFVCILNLVLFMVRFQGLPQPKSDFVINEYRQKYQGTLMNSSSDMGAEVSASSPPSESLMPIKQQCGVEKDDESNTFSFRGTWVENPSLGAALDEQQQELGCKQPLLSPYNTHRCCSERGTDYLQSTFCPEMDTTQAIHSFLNATQRKTVLFLGDSMTETMFASVGLAMRALQIPFRHIVKKNQYEELYVVPSSNTTIRLIKAYRLDDVNRTGMNIQEPNSTHFIKDDILQAALQQTHVFLSNFGLHHWGKPEYHYRQYKHVQELVLRENKLRSNPLCLLWRRTMPQHFASKTGGGEWGDRVPTFGSYGCVPLNRTWHHPSDQALARIQREFNHSTATLDFTSILQDAHEFHSRRKGADCSHMCYSPLIWNPILHVTAQAIQQSCH
ncbi:expressed unknown protein [Seminavis robusta]|uniref:Uncharacterized protein n=1 Tax=Seminavis robusta TaxID=568900 RepID=A0A9N8F2D5_9STRA|nr:expressed unknown protein [Seminavis robusta]|eukprot:Sro2407_g326570.1 n/a (405) ;mRNA; f:8798-10012